MHSNDIRDEIIALYKNYKSGKMSQDEYTISVLNTFHDFIDSEARKEEKHNWKDRLYGDDIRSEMDIIIIENLSRLNPEKIDPICFFRLLYYQEKNSRNSIKYIE